MAKTLFFQFLPVQIIWPYRKKETAAKSILYEKDCWKLREWLAMNTQSPHYSTQVLLPIISVETQTSVQVKRKKIFYLCDEFHRTIFLDTFQKMKTPTKHSSIFLFHGTSYAAIQTFFYKAFPHKKINRQRAKKNIFGRTFFKVLTQLCASS